MVLHLKSQQILMAHYYISQGKDARILQVPCVKSGNHIARNIIIRHMAKLQQ